MYVPIITNLDNVFKIGPRNNINKNTTFKIGKKRFPEPLRLVKRIFTAEEDHQLTTIFFKNRQRTPLTIIGFIYFKKLHLWYFKVVEKCNSYRQNDISKYRMRETIYTEQ